MARIHARGAAIVMVGVFAIFATLGMIDFKMMGVGLAVAVLLGRDDRARRASPGHHDAAGDWNWYLPRWLAWLPRVSREAPSTRAEPGRGTPVGA